MTDREMTGLQRQSLEHVARAKAEGLSLGAYARLHGVSARQIYAATAYLRRRGLLPRAAAATREKFVAVTSAPPPSTRAPVVCRLALDERLVIDCVQWPPRDRLTGLSEPDAAP